MATRNSGNVTGRPVVDKIQRSILLLELTHIRFIAMELHGGTTIKYGCLSLFLERLAFLCLLSSSRLKREECSVSKMDE